MLGVLGNRQPTSCEAVQHVVRLSRENGAYLAVDHFLRGLRLIKRMKKSCAWSRALLLYRGSSLIRNTHLPRTTIGPEALGYCWVPRGGGGSGEPGTSVAATDVEPT